MKQTRGGGVNTFESSQNKSQYFEDTLRKAGINIQKRESGERDSFRVANGVNIEAKNGRQVNRIPGVLYPGSRFDNEPAYVSILDSFSRNPQLKQLFDTFTKAGLVEATGGQNAQWGTWKFAIRSQKDADTVMRAVKRLQR